MTCLLTSTAWVTEPRPGETVLVAVHFSGFVVDRVVGRMPELGSYDEVVVLPAASVFATTRPYLSYDMPPSVWYLGSPSAL